MHGDSGSPNDVDPGRHLTEDDLSELVDGNLAPDMRQRFDAHLEICPDCRAALADLMALTSILGTLTLADVPRSFQLGPEHARETGPAWSRLANRLLPALPAMRAGTIALALALSGVTAARIFQDSPETNRSIVGESTIVAAANPALTSIPILIESATAQTDTLAPPVSATESGGAAQKEPGESNSAPAPELESTSPLTQTDQPEFDQTTSVATSSDEFDSSGAAGSGPAEEAGDTAPGDQSREGTDDIQSDESSGSTESEASDSSITTAMEMPASPTLQPTNTITATSSPTETATSSPTAAATSTVAAQPTAEPERASTDDNQALSRVQVVLAVLLLALGALAFGVGRVARRPGR